MGGFGGNLVGGSAKGGGGLYDIVKQSNSQAVASLGSVFAGPLGIKTSGWTFNALETSDLDWTSGPFSIAVWFNTFVSTGTAGAIASRAIYVDETNNQGWSVTQQNTNQLRFSVYNNNASALYALNITDDRTIDPIYYVATSDATTRRAYLHGIHVASTGNSPVPASAGSLAISNTIPTAGRVSAVYLMMIWNRLLTPTEVLNFKVSPYSLISPSSSMALMSSPLASIPKLAKSLTALGVT